MNVQWLLATLAVAAVAHLGTVFGQTGMCGALPQTAEVLRKFQKFEAIYDDYFIHAGGDIYRSGRNNIRFVGYKRNLVPW